MRKRSLVLSGAAAVAAVLATAGTASAATVTGSPASGPTASEITISPASLTFAPQKFLVPSASQTVTVTNTSSQPALISDPEVDAQDNFNFGVSSSTCESITLAVGASCTVSIFVDPGSVGPLSTMLTVVVGAYPHLTIASIPITGEGIS